MNRKHPANRIWFCIVLSTALWLPVGHAQTTRLWNNYQVYQPEITRGILVDTDNNQLKLRYNHCASTVFYQDRWFTVWNANTIAAEGDLGQLIYLSTSTDFTHWTVPEPVFSTGATSINPIGPTDHGRMQQWQPNLLVTDGELWCTWGENGKKPELVGTYCSKLASANGRWKNTKILLPGDSGPPVIHPEIDGIVWRAFPSQNPVELSGGRIVAPVTLREKKGSFPAAQKRNAVIYTDDRGANWRLSELIQLPAAPTGQWEPTVYELDSGEIAMIARRNDKTNLVSPAEILLFATSSDKGATWSEYEVLPLEVLSSRMHVLNTGNRFCMIYNDHRLGDAGRKVDRYNLALFTSPSGRARDWMPGVSVTHNLWGVAYPQMFEKDDALYAAFSQGSSRSIHTARIRPKPDPARHCIFPRHLMDSRPDVRNGMLAFDFRQLIKSKWKMDLGKGDFSIAARLVPRHRGMVVDGRAKRKGMVLALKKVGEGLAVSCSIAGFPGGSRSFTMSETVPKGRPLYAGVSFQNGKRLRLYVNHAVEAFEISDRINLSTGAPLFFGSLQHTNSALFNYYGLIDQLLVFNRALDDDEHALLQSGGVQRQRTAAAAQQRHLQRPRLHDGTCRNL
ncbi:MAG: exo-alpha-sialidase [Kiritimatiellales bacterium]|nr:exo-alpha-sialidase [Kiritimatiellales bacterium]